MLLQYRSIKCIRKYGKIVYPVRELKTKQEHLTCAIGTSRGTGARPGGAGDGGRRVRRHKAQSERNIKIISLRRGSILLITEKRGKKTGD